MSAKKYWNPRFVSASMTRCCAGSARTTSGSLSPLSTAPASANSVRTRMNWSSIGAPLTSLSGVSHGSGTRNGTT
jgi:hypothetical protein